MDEVVVNKGYYTESKRLSTGNVSTVTAKDIEKQPVTDPLLALQGRVPGLYITQSSGVPGNDVTVRIQGQNSIRVMGMILYILLMEYHILHNYLLLVAAGNLLGMYY